LDHACDRSPTEHGEDSRRDVRLAGAGAGARGQAYITYPDGIGRSRVTAAMIEAKLGTHGTARNWNTVVKLGTLSSASGGGPRAGTPA
jgi:hypothetical protein